MEWHLAEAKNKFSELINLALSDGPQRVIRRNDAVIILAQKDYDQLIGKHPSFKDFLLDKKEPTLEGIDLSRDRSTMRDVGL